MAVWTQVKCPNFSLIFLAIRLPSWDSHNQPLVSAVGPGRTYCEIDEIVILCHDNIILSPPEVLISKFRMPMRWATLLALCIGISNPKKEATKGSRFMTWLFCTR